MNLKKILAGCTFLPLLLLIACSSEAITAKEQHQITDNIKTLEKSEYELTYFFKDYPAYLAQVDQIIAPSYIEAIGNQTVFGYEDKIYTRKHLKGMPRGEWERHKIHMLNLSQATGLNEQKATIMISEPYRGKSRGQAYVYTSEHKEFRQKPFTKTNRRYELALIEGTWKIIGVEQDHFTYGERSAEETKSMLDGMKYQKHDDEPVTYIKEKELKIEGMADL